MWPSSHLILIGSVYSGNPDTSYVAKTHVQEGRVVGNLRSIGYCLRLHELITQALLMSQSGTDVGQDLPKMRLMSCTHGILSHWGQLSHLSGFQFPQSLFAGGCRVQWTAV